MLKLLGSLLVVVASIGIAYGIREEMSAHLRLLYDVRKLFVDISCGASDLRQPVEQLLRCFVTTRDVRLNCICDEMAGRLIEKKDGRGEEVWRNTFFAHRAELGLREDEAEVIESAGSAFFGKSMRENEKHLAVVLERLDFLIEAVRNERNEKQKVYGTLSVMSGLMIVILLM